MLDYTLEQLTVNHFLLFDTTPYFIVSVKNIHSVFFQNLKKKFVHINFIIVRRMFCGADSLIILQ